MGVLEINSGVRTRPFFFTLSLHRLRIFQKIFLNVPLIVRFQEHRMPESVEKLTDLRKGVNVIIARTFYDLRNLLLSEDSCKELANLVFQISIAKLRTLTYPIKNVAC